MLNLGQALEKVASYAALPKKGMLPVKEAEELDPFDQYQATSRGGELLGTGTGALSGALLGKLIANKAGGGLLAPVVGATALGLLGKQLGRFGGEQVGLNQLEELSGTPWERG